MDNTLNIVFALGQDLGLQLEFRPKLNNKLVGNLGLWFLHMLNYGFVTNGMSSFKIDLKGEKDQIFGPDFLYVIINLISFKITFSNMGAYCAPSLISGGGPKRPPPRI